MSTLEMFKQEGRIEGKVEGKVEGKIEERIETIQKMHKNGFTVEQIVKALDLDEEFVKEAIEKKK